MQLGIDTSSHSSLALQMAEDQETVHTVRQTPTMGGIDCDECFAMHNTGLEMF